MHTDRHTDACTITCSRGKRVHKEECTSLMLLTTCLDAGESGRQSVWKGHEAEGDK